MKQGNLTLLNGKIYTMDVENRCVESVVVKEGVIVYAGNNTGAGEYFYPGMDVIDLEGKTVLPGFMEPHVHVPGNAYNVLFNINLFDAKTLDETMTTISDFIEKHPERGIYYGRGYMASVFPGIEAGLGPKKERLDEICPDKPVVLIDFGGHQTWLNSAAFDAFGITPDSKVEGGVVEVDPQTGELWGTLKDEAKVLYPDMTYTLEENIRSVEWLQDFMNQYGYTSIFALRPSGCDDPVPLLDAMSELERSNQLTLRSVCAREIKVNYNEHEQIDETCALAEKYHDGMIKVKTAKYFLDGAVEGASGFLLEPYEAAAGKGDNYYGTCLWEQERLENAFIETLQKGLNIHIHAIGDGAVHAAVDALEAAQKAVPGDHRNTITHLQLVAEEDKRRMGQLGIIGCCNVHWHLKDPSIYYDAELPFLGKERAEHEYPLKSLLDEGVVITSSGDIPITAYPNPFFAIQIGATRNMVNADFFKVDPITDIDDPTWLLNKDERISVRDMVKAYTVNPAFANHVDDEIGSIEIGKYGDMIIIDQDIFNIDLIDIEKTKVLQTFVGGVCVYEM